MTKETRLTETAYRLILIPLIALGLLSILATGGGGGGGGGGTVGGLTYVGNTDPTVITATNASTLVASVLGSTALTGFTGTANNSGATSTRTLGITDLAQRLNEDFHRVLAQTRTTLSVQRFEPAAMPIDVTEDCDNINFGTIRIFGALADNGTGTLTIVFNNCQLGGETLDGTGTFRIDVFDLLIDIPTDFTISLSLMTFRSPSLGIDINISGSLRSQINIGSNTETITLNPLIGQDNSTGEMIKAEPLVVVNVYDNILFPTAITSETITGRLFDSADGFVDITTTQPLELATLMQAFPNAGQVKLTGAMNASVTITVLSVTLVRLEVDLDGDGGTDLTAIMKWTELGGPVGADLNDDDGDTMHNSWETENGLDKSDATDAVGDPDTDTFTNLQEYQAGSDPNDAGSTP
jgi:hypothetical protein